MNGERSRLAELVDALPQPCLTVTPVLDAGGSVVDVALDDLNRAACGLLGGDRDELVGRSILDLAPGLGPEVVRTCCEAVRSGLHHETRGIRTSGADGDRLIDVWAVPLGDAIALVLDDVTRETRAVRALEDLQHSYRLLIDHVSDVVFQGGTDPSIDWISPSVRDLLGWDPDDVVGRTVADLVLEEDRAAIAGARAELGVPDVPRATRPASCAATGPRSGSRPTCGPCSTRPAPSSVAPGRGETSPRSTPRPSCCGSARCTTRSPG